MKRTLVGRPESWNRSCLTHNHEFDYNWIDLVCSVTGGLFDAGACRFQFVHCAQAGQVAASPGKLV
jgi:hypothetical protein